MTMEELFNNHYILALYGFILYSALMFVFTKDKYDDADEHFSVKKYWSHNWDNMALSLLFVPFMVYKAEEAWNFLMDYYEKDWEFTQLYYMFLGAVVEAMYFALAWIKKKIRAAKNG